MIKKTVTYTDYDGRERTEDYYFHMTNREVVKWETECGGEGGMEKLLDRIIKEEDREKIVSMLDDLILRAYGEKTDDGRGFVKTDEIRKRFENSAAYDEMFVELFSDVDKMADFVNGISPTQGNGSPAPIEAVQ